MLTFLEKGEVAVALFVSDNAIIFHPATSVCHHLVIITQWKSRVFEKAIIIDPSRGSV
jgi:hypothetical protein